MRFSPSRLVGYAGFLFSAAILFASLLLFPKGPPNTLAWYLYGISIVLLLVALPTLSGRWFALIRRLQDKPRIYLNAAYLYPWIALVVILAFALVIRLYNLDLLPAGLWFDEADNIRHANRINLDPGSTPVFVPSTNLPSLFLMPIALVIKLAGISITTARVISVAFGLAGIAAMFLLVRHIMGTGLGLVAAFLVAVMRWDINWSRIGMHGITTPFFAALTAFLMFRAIGSRRASDFGFTGASLGLGLWFYAPFRLFPIVVAFILIHSWIFNREDRRKLLLNTGVMALVAVIVAAPVIQSAIVDSDDFFARTRTTSVFSDATFGEAVNHITTNLGKHLLMLHLKGDPNPRHNLPGAPMLDFVSGILLLVGIALALSRWRSAAFAVLPFWMLFMILPGVITLPAEAPQSLRSITMIPAIVALITLALGAIWRWGRLSPLPVIRKATPVFLATLLGAIAFLNIDTYFGAQASHPEVYASFSTDETLMAPHMLVQQGRGYSLYVSEQYLFGLTTTLLANNPRREIIAAPTNIPLDAASVSQGAAIYLEPREAGFYQVLKAYYPDAQFQEIRPPMGGEVLYYSAIISREQLEQAQGLIERRTLPDGTTIETTKPTTESTGFAEGPVPFSIEWAGAVHFDQPGQYILVLEGNTDAQVILDGGLILSSEENSVAIEPAVGLHTLEVKAQVESLDSTIRLLWRPPNGELASIPRSNLFHGDVRPIGLAGRFFQGGKTDAEADTMRITPTLDAFWFEPVLSEPYRAKWEGTLFAPEGGEYTFALEASGDLKLTLNGNFVAETVGQSEGKINLASGANQIVVEYFSEFPPPRFRIRWKPPRQEMQPIPVELLKPEQSMMYRIVNEN